MHLHPSEGEPRDVGGAINGFEAALKSMSTTIWRAPASCSLSISFACQERGHGHTCIS